MSKPVPRWEWAALGGITLLAAALRLIGLSKVSPDPFYDAAVRSMSLSFHNFFFGAFEPGASVSIDKPPIDLWFQVVSVKVLGFSSTTLKLPEVFAGTASAPLLYAAVRRMWNAPAALASAAAIAVLPVEVITARSDTMDAVMMALIVLALLLLVRAAETDGMGFLLGAAAALGVAFNVKLLESLIALPGLAAFALMALPGDVRRRLIRLGLAGLVYVAVSLSWLTATLLVPAHDRPFAIGSTNGSAWNAAFVFNGTERLSAKSSEPSGPGTVYEPGRHYPTATQSQRDHIPIVPASATRLLARVGPLSGERLGLELLVGLLLGVPALLLGTLRPELAGFGEPAEDDDDEGSGEKTAVRIRRAAAVGLLLWTLTGIVLFSHMARLHPRYVEAFTPAVAALVGIGVAWVASPGGRERLYALTGVLAVVVYYSERLLYGRPAIWWLGLLCALGAIALLALATRGGTRRPAAGELAPAGVLVLTLCAVLAIPVRADVTAIHDHVTDAGYVGALPTEEQRLVSSYLRAHQGGAYYEVAAESATQIGSLIVKDARPVLMLTSYAARVLTTVPELEREISRGRVRYAFLNSSCPRHASAGSNPACSAPAQWVRANGTDVSLQAGLSHHKILWLLPGVTP